MTITVSGKLLGKTRPLFSDWKISLPADIFQQEKISAKQCLAPTLRDLLTHIVVAEVEAFRLRQEERRVTRVFSAAEIKQGVATGKVDMGGRELAQEIDTQAAVNNALQAFEDGFYYVFIDDIQQEDLNGLVSITSNSQVLFLRLVPLVGG